MGVEEAVTVQENPLTETMSPDVLDHGRADEALPRTLRVELERDRPRATPCRLSRSYRTRLVERGFHALYRWYLAQSQSKRNWNPDRDFDWAHVRKDHDPRLMNVVEGFYAVEQYAPDYGAELTRLARRDYGRSHFYLRWAAEEERHASLWRNALLFSGARQRNQIEDYTDALRAKAWQPPWDDPLHMLLYTVLQERATELIYLNLARAARGAGSRTDVFNAVDPVLAKVAAVIAADEAAHYHFFLEAARVSLYYFPEDALPALGDVLRGFVMPASTLVPNYDAFTADLYAGRLFGRIMYAREVVPPSLDKLSVLDRRILLRGDGTAAAKAETGAAPITALYQAVNREALESTVIRLFEKLGRDGRELGLADDLLDRFVPHGWS